MDFLKDFDVEVPEQVIEVPKVSLDMHPGALLWICDLRHPQMAEQLMEVPTVLSLARIAGR